MLKLAVSVALLSSLAAASPIETKPEARVVKLAARPRLFSPDKVFDYAAAEKDRLQQRYKRNTWKTKAKVNGSGAAPTKRSDERSEPVDINVYRRTTGYEVLTDDYDGVDELYYGPYSIGTPAQSTNADIDTGSSDLVVPIQSCANGCTGPLFTTTKSSTYKQSSTSFSIQYEDGSGASGYVATDTVTMAGYTVTSQGFGAVNSETDGFGAGPNAGLIGMGFPANAESGKTPFVFNLFNQGSLPAKLFSVFMARNGASGSELCLGCIDSSKYTGTITYYPLNPSATGGTQYYWNVLSGGMSYNGAVTGSSFDAVIDTGTTLAYVPTSTASALYAKIPGAKSASSTVGSGGYTFPCSTTLGTIAMKFGSQSYTINPADFNLGPVSSGSSSCVGGVFGGSSDATIGDLFIKNVYTVFNYGTSSVGFAPST